MPNLATDLARVMEKLDRADAGQWRLYDEKLRPEFPTRVMEIQQANGVAVIPWPGFDSPSKTRAQRRNNAMAIIAAVNFLRFYGPYIAETFKETPNG